MVVDREGKIVSIGRPTALTAEQLNQFLAVICRAPPLDKADEILKQKMLNAAKGEKEPANTEPPQLSITIRPSKATGAMMGGGPGIFQVSGADLKSTLGAIYGVNQSKIEIPAQFPGCAV